VCLWCVCVCVGGVWLCGVWVVCMVFVLVHVCEFLCGVCMCVVCVCVVNVCCVLLWVCVYGV